MRHPACTAPSASVKSCAADAWASDIPDPTSAKGVSQSLLYQQSQITVDDETALVTRLGQAMPTARLVWFGFGTNIIDSEGAMHFTGPQQYIQSAHGNSACNRGRLVPLVAEDERDTAERH